MIDPTTPNPHPLRMGEILDAAFKVYRARFRTLCLCVLVPVVPLTILQVLVTALTSENAFEPRTEPVSTADAAQLTSLGATGVATSLLSLLALAACTRTVAAARSGESVEWPDSVRFALARFFPLMLALIATLAFTFVGFAALLLPGLYIIVRLAVVVPALLVEDLGAGAALGRSWQLVGGRWWATAGILLLTVVLVAIIGGLIQAAFVAPLVGGDEGELLGGVLTALGQIVASVITLPLQAAVVAILYFDLRLRKEGAAPRFAAPEPGGVAGDEKPSGPTFGGFAPPRPADSGPRRT